MWKCFLSLHRLYAAISFEMLSVSCKHANPLGFDGTDVYTMRCFSVRALFLNGAYHKTRITNLLMTGEKKLLTSKLSGDN